MGKSVLPEVLREDIKELLKKGYTREAVSRFVENETRKYVKSAKQLEQCIASIERIVPNIHKKGLDYPMPPRSEDFNSEPYSSIIARISKRTPLKKIEEKGSVIAKDILRKKEKFRKVIVGPNFAGTPFDLFGYKGKKPYIIEMKCSLHNYNSPGEIQKKRMQELLRNIKGLNVALIQIKLKEAEYRIFYDNQMDLLFYGPKMPLGPIENWLRSTMNN